MTCEGACEGEGLAREVEIMEGVSWLERRRQWVQVGMWCVWSGEMVVLLEEKAL